jgi:hypothetical protein
MARRERTVHTKLSAGGGGAARSAYRGWERAREGAICAAPIAESEVWRARFAALRWGKREALSLNTTTSATKRGASVPSSA